MSEADAVQIGVAGLGGYARTIANLIIDKGPTVEPGVVLAAACDPDLAAHGKRADALRQHGVTLYDSYEQMLAHPGLEAVWLPVPIDLHVPFAEQALAAGLAVMLEKPVAGTLGEVDRLIAARDAADRPVLVGFQDIYDDTTLPLKRRLLSGELGRVQSATVHGCWPRDTAYFGRAAWAGALRRGDTWVLDSPLNNAMAHFVNIALFLLGRDEARSATPIRLAAELYRAADIENYDTACVRVTLEPPYVFSPAPGNTPGKTPGPVELLILLTHATSVEHHPVIHIHTDRGQVRRTLSDLEITLDGQTQTTPRNDQMHRCMLHAFAQCVRGQTPENSALATLEVARVHTLMVNAVSEAAPIRPVPADAIQPVPTGAGVVQSIPGLEAAFTHCAAHQQMLHESGWLPFTSPPADFDLTGYARFAGPAGIESA